MDENGCYTVSKAGIREKRVYVNSGKFLIYEYVADNGKSSQKLKIILKDNEGNHREFFIIPTKGKKYLVFEAESKGERGVFKGVKCIGVEEFL